MTGIYELYVQTHFSAAHALVGYPGDCARTHGHNWIVEVHVRCARLDHIGIGLDFREIKKVVEAVLADLDHANLNELQPFQQTNPSSENIARHVYQQVSKKLNSPQVRVSKVKISETPGAGALYWEET